MFGWLFGRKIESVTKAEKTVRIKGVRFRLRKINPIDYLNGSKAVLQTYDIYRKEPSMVVDEMSLKKIKEHYSDVILAGVVSPKIVRKKDESGVFIDEMFVDWELVEALYASIMEFSYGKKKVKALRALANSPARS